MYEDSPYHVPVLCRTRAHGVQFLAGLLTGGIAAFALVALCLLGCLLGGCSAPGDYYGERPAVAAANAKPGLFGGITDAAPAVVAGAVRSASWLNALGGVLLAAGCFALSQNGVRNSLGFGLALAGTALLVAGFILPVYAGWVGLALFGGLVVWFWGRMRIPDAPPDSVNKLDSPGLFSRLKGLFA